VVIATKFPRGSRRALMRCPRTLEASLSRLRRGSVDLYQHHFPSRRVSIPALMDLMAEAVKAGKVKAVGVSNYSASQMRIAHEALARHGIPLASNQVQYSLLHRQPEVDGVLDACRSSGHAHRLPAARERALTGKYVNAAGPKASAASWASSVQGAGAARAGRGAAPADRREVRQDAGAGRAAVLIENPLVLPIPGAKERRSGGRERWGALVRFDTGGKWSRWARLRWRGGPGRGNAGPRSAPVVGRNAARSVSNTRRRRQACPWGGQREAWVRPSMSCHPSVKNPVVQHESLPGPEHFRPPLVITRAWVLPHDIS